MRKIFPLIFCFSLSLIQAQEKSVHIRNLRGMASNYEGSNLREDLVKNVQNVLFDRDLGIVKPDGFTRDNTTSLGSQTVLLWQFVTSTGTEYLIGISSNLLVYNSGNGTYTTIISTLNPLYTYDCVSGLKRFTCTSTTGSFYLDGTLVSGNLRVIDSTASFPLGSMIAKHANRLWVSGTISNPSVLYGSAFLDGDNWTLGGNAGDPVSFTFGLNDGDILTGIYSAYDKLYVGKSRSFWKLIGRSQNDFQQVNISPLIGVLQNKSIRDKSQNLYWLSQRGIEKLDIAGDFIYPLFSDPIKDVTDKMVSGYGFVVTKNFSDTSESDFEAGVSTWVNTVSNPGSVFISSPSVFKSTGTIWDTTEANTYIRWYNNADGVVMYDGKIAMSFVPKITSKLIFLRAHVKVLPTTSIGIYPTIYNDDGSGMSPGTTLIFKGSTITVGPGIGPWSELDPTFFVGSVSSGGVILTQGVTYWAVLNATASDCTSGGANDLALGGCPATQINTIVSTDPFTSDQTVRGMKATGSAAWSFYPNSGVYIDIRLSSAQIISQTRDLGTSVNNYDRFSVGTVLKDGSIQFYDRSAASLASLNAAAWTAQSVSGGLAVGTARFFQWRADLGITASSQSPSIQDVSLSWFDGQTKMNSASWVFDDRYYLSGSTNTAAASTNETVIVVDKFDNFTRLNGLNASSFAEAFGKKYFGVSTSTGGDTGLVFKFTPGAYNYDGKPIDSFFETKDYCADPPACAAVNEWNKVYIQTKNPGTVGGTLSSQYQFNSDGNYSSLGDVRLNETGGLINSKVMFPFGSGGTIGNSLRLKFSNAQLNQPMNFLGAEAFYTVRITD